MEFPVAPSEKALFALIAAGDETAFRAFFERYREKVYAATLHLGKSRLIAEELTQEVFISIWVSRGSLARVDDPVAYLYRIVYNKFNSFLRKQANEVRILAAYRQTHPAISNQTEETILLNESRAILDKAIENLSPQKKTIYRMSREQGMSYVEIARALGVSPNTVKNHLAEATRLIRQHMGQSSLSIAVIEIVTHLFR